MKFGNGLLCNNCIYYIGIYEIKFFVNLILFDNVENILKVFYLSLIFLKEFVFYYMVMGFF